MKFKKRDKVKVYGGISRDPADWNHKSTPLAYLRGSIATVVDIIADDEMYVRFEGGYETEVHPNQCRKARK